MKKDYIKIYKDSYKKAEIEVEKQIITKYISFKKNRKNANYAGNNIAKEFYDEQQVSEIVNGELQPLYSLFGKRFQEYAEEYHMDIIEDKLLPKFLEITNSSEIAFESYVKKLAIFNARDKISNTFSNNGDLYSLMFKLDNFSEFFIKGLDGGHHSAIYEKYRVLYYEKTKEKKIIETVKPPIFKIQEHKAGFYEIKDEYYDNFLSIDFYNFLTKNIINDEKTTFEDFTIVFTHNPDLHDRKIHFLCSTVLASVFITELQSEIFDKLIISKIAKKCFYTSKGRIISENNISKSKGNATESHKRKIEKLLAIFNEINADSKKSQ